MSVTREFYQACADECAAEAAAATLPNVRERALRSEASWRGLANQARKVMVDRQKSEREKAERIAAENPPVAAIPAELPVPASPS